MASLEAQVVEADELFDSLLEVLEPFDEEVSLLFDELEPVSLLVVLSELSDVEELFLAPLRASFL